MLAGALVMEVGGMLSHGAILARELGIPTVGQVKDATRILRNGQRILVDGNTGRITMEG
jgi:pyruvate,water dikinase